MPLTSSLSRLCVGELATFFNSAATSGMLQASSVAIRRTLVRASVVMGSPLRKPFRLFPGRKRKGLFVNAGVDQPRQLLARARGALVLLGEPLFLDHHHVEQVGREAGLVAMVLPAIL